MGLRASGFGVVGFNPNSLAWGLHTRARARTRTHTRTHAHTTRTLAHTPDTTQANVVPMMAMGVSALKKELSDKSFVTGGCAQGQIERCLGSTIAGLGYGSLLSRRHLLPCPPSKTPPTEMPEIHQFLDGFYLSRIGIRMLIGQHISLHEPPKSAHIGLICTKCSPWQVCT